LHTWNSGKTDNIWIKSMENRYNTGENICIFITVSVQNANAIALKSKKCQSETLAKWQTSKFSVRDSGSNPAKLNGIDAERGNRYLMRFSDVGTKNKMD